MGAGRDGHMLEFEYYILDVSAIMFSFVNL